jgi:[acyl-carrier-protein] S-malonyltransferase
MGRDLAQAFSAARLVFEEVDEALKQNLSHLMFEGPEEDLTLTENAQPAIMTVSIAALRVLVDEGGVDIATVCGFVAGHSLGEYSALAAAGTLSLADTTRLLRIRGGAMQQAVPVGEGAMAALLGLDVDDARAVVKEASATGVCVVANDNAPGQVVVSGARPAVEQAVEIAAGLGARRAVMLPVSAPFHCPLMGPAADAMAEALAAVTMTPPRVPLVANVTAAVVTDPAEILRLLVEQVTGMVRWRECILTLRDQGVDTLVEIGAGKVLSGLARRIDRDLATHSVGMPDEIEAFLKTL